MDEIFKNIKELISFIWKPAKTQEEKVIKRYDILIALCILFMVGYVCIFVLKLESHIESNTSNISLINNADNGSGNPAIYVAPDTEIHPQYTNQALTDKEYFIGEIVGIKYFGVFGLVTEKTLGARGYAYTVRWETSDHSLPTDNFFAWELYRPLPGSVPVSVLRP